MIELPYWKTLPVARLAVRLLISLTAVLTFLFLIGPVILYREQKTGSAVKYSAFRCVINGNRAEDEWMERASSTRNNYDFTIFLISS